MSELKVASCFEFEKVLRGKSNKLFYPKSEVDAAIAELKAENERLVKCCKEYDSRQRIDEQIKFNGAQQLRATKRALWLARANRAMAEAYSVLNDVLTSNRWVKALRKLKAKAEEYK